MPNIVDRIEIGLLFLRMKQANRQTKMERIKSECACVCVYILLDNQSTNTWITIFDPKKEQHRNLQPAEKFDQNCTKQQQQQQQQKRFIYIYVHEAEDKLKLKKKYKENECVCDMRAQKSKRIFRSMET